MFQSMDRRLTRCSLAPLLPPVSSLPVYACRAREHLQVGCNFRYRKRTTQSTQPDIHCSGNLEIAY